VLQTQQQLLSQLVLLRCARQRAEALPARKLACCADSDLTSRAIVSVSAASLSVVLCPLLLVMWGRWRLCAYIPRSMVSSPAIRGWLLEAPESDAVWLRLTCTLARPELPIQLLVLHFQATQNLGEFVFEARFEQPFPLSTGQQGLDVDKIADDVCKHRRCGIENSLGVAVCLQFFLVARSILNDLAQPLLDLRPD
jgi:hypothetical protein